MIPKGKITYRPSVNELLTLTGQDHSQKECTGSPNKGNTVADLGKVSDVATSRYALILTVSGDHLKVPTAYCKV